MSGEGVVVGGGGVRGEVGAGGRVVAQGRTVEGKGQADTHYECDWKGWPRNLSGSKPGVAVKEDNFHNSEVTPTHIPSFFLCHARTHTHSLIHTHTQPCTHTLTNTDLFLSLSIHLSFLISHSLIPSSLVCFTDMQ